MPPEFDIEAKPPSIRRLLVQPGMIALYLVVTLGWAAMLLLGTGGLLADVQESRDGNLIPATPANATPESDNRFEELLGTIVGPTPLEPSRTPESLQGTTPRPTLTRGNNSFGDIFRTREP